LEERACALAESLSGLGVSEGSVVAVYGPVCPDFIASCLAILKLGAVFFPLDSNLSPNRLSALLGSVPIAALVGLASMPPAVPPYPKLMLRAGSLGVEGGRERPAFRAPPGTASLFFTSGTTGKPKGIWGSSQALSHFITWEQGMLEVGPGDRFANFTRAGFDAILRDILTPLSSGACVVLPPAEMREGGPQVPGWIGTERISAFHAVPSLVESWFAGEAEACISPSNRSLRAAAFSGEPLRGNLVSRLRERILAPSARIFNYYGPSETLMIKSCYELPNAVLPGPVPLGEPLPFCHLHVLNRAHAPCDTGETGEIFISTPFAGPCYVDSADSEGRFLVDPFDPAGRRQMYRTGDFGMRNHDMDLLFLGRKDDEIKVNGQRINLNAIAQAVESIPGVGGCCVLAHAPGPSRSEQVAFYVAANGFSLGEHEMRRLLAEILPAAAIPNRFIRLDKIPLDTNAKADRKALQRMLMEVPPVPRAEPPGNPTQERVHEVWRKFLRLDSLGIDENFFAAGGHSLLATVIITQIRASFGIHIPLATFLENPTIRQLSRAVDDLLLASVENLSEEELLKLL
jgi:amino acid adenylation domain-containing protein